MLTFRSILLSSFALLLWGADARSQTFPVQTPPIAQQQTQQQQVQQQQIQQQRMQQERMQTPLFGQQGGTSVYQQQSQPIRVAASTLPQTGLSVPLYNPGGQNQSPMVAQPGTTQGIPQGVTHVGRAEPASRVVPFFLNPDEQKELDEFLARWERFSVSIKRYDVEFNLFEYNLADDATPNRPQRILGGSFNYIANPTRFLYTIKGEYRDGKFIERDGDKNPHIYAEKIIIDEKTVTKYDYNAKTVHQINVPSEMIGKGIADSPLPLIFGAKADELKRRFSMKVVTNQNGLTHLYARPLLIEDQQEFKELVVVLEKDLRARGLQQWNINDKAYKLYDLKSTKIDDRMGHILGDIATIFKPEVERGWKKEVQDWGIQPSPAPATPQMPIGNPASPQFRNEVPLYQGR